MKPLVYIETTIPSYYFEVRPGLAADAARTREWWDRERDRYDCYISPIVLDELNQGDYPTKKDCLSLVAGLPLLTVNQEVLDIAKVYQERSLTPKNPVRDALHVALASYYRVDFLLTWNCRHIANANKARHMEKLNAQMHLGLPLLVTPHLLRLLEETP